MISGSDVVVSSKNAEADRAFFRVLEFKSVDAGHGWLIFALPPTEAAHPSEVDVHELYLMCDDLKTDLRGSVMIRLLNEAALPQSCQCSNSAKYNAS